MNLLGRITTTLLLILFLVTTPSTAAIKHINFRFENRPTILLDKFGFTHNGNISITISNLSVTSMIEFAYDPSLVGFYLLSDETVTQLLLESHLSPALCVLNSMYVSLHFTFKDIPSNQSSFHKSFTVTGPNDNEYALFFSNCNFESAVTLDLLTELYNTNDKGTTRDYLPVGLTQIPLLYFIFSLVYMCFFAIWVYGCCQNRLSVQRVHVLMGALLATKMVNMLTAAGANHYLKVTGSYHGWNVLFYIFQLISSVLLFTVIVLIGAGWLYLKPIIQAREKVVLIIVIGSRVLVNVASIVMSETGQVSKDWAIWSQVLMWADVICWSASIIPIIWSFRALNERKTDEKASRNLRLFTQFYRVVVNYFIITRIGVFVILMDNVSYEYQWVCVAAEEAASVVLCLVMFYMFRPDDKTEYFVLNNEEGVAMVKGDEFEGANV